jgi:hypothetical protein
MPRITATLVLAFALTLATAAPATAAPAAAEDRDLGSQGKSARANGARELSTHGFRFTVVDRYPAGLRWRVVICTSRAARVRIRAFVDNVEFHRYHFVRRQRAGCRLHRLRLEDEDIDIGVDTTSWLRLAWRDQRSKTPTDSYEAQSE